MTNRYDTLTSKEGQFQPDSNDQVLLNKIGITDSSDMDDVELDLLEQLTESILHEVSEDQTITIADLSEWHRRWLGNVYDWAGEYRSVNMGKDGFQFAAAHLIHGLMNKFGDDFLSITQLVMKWRMSNLSRHWQMYILNIFLFIRFEKGMDDFLDC